MEPKKKNTTLKTEPAEKKKILIAEDDPFLRKALGSFMEEEGLEIIFAQNGQEAIDLLRKNHYRLILLDINMPLKNGFDVLREISKLTDPPPTLVFSNFDSPESKDEALALGAKEYFVKHKVDIDDLRMVVRTYLVGGIE
jgi:DNA-binding response OmpR family regulator